MVATIARTRVTERCLIGPGAIAEAGAELALLGRRALVIGGTRAIEAVRPALFAALDAAGLAYDLQAGPHVRNTRPAVDALVAAGRAATADVVVACGGGAIMDCGKAVAHGLSAPLINVPTVASTNACGTTGAVVEGHVGPRPAYRGAAAIVADTAIIARAGGRWLASGMGDALPTWYGAQLALGRGPDGQAGVSATRVALARLCTDLILDHGAAAFDACGRGEATPDVDRVVEAIVYCSGAARFGMTGDHQLHPAHSPAARPDLIHGEWVAYGLLTRLVLGGEVEVDLPALIRFLQRVNLPTRLADLGLAASAPDILLDEARRIVAAAGP
jgi:glycerol dehydrogenase